MRCCVWLLLLTLLPVAMVSCVRNPGSGGEPPLLLEEPGGGKGLLGPPEGPVADNSRCHVCHINFAEEELAVTHARADIGCEDCHGDCTAHCSDEDNITPPDIMYPKGKVNSFCLGCHSKEGLSDVHKPFMAGTAKEKYCTECHGEHRVPHRTRQWDKETGKLLRDDGVRMMSEEPMKRK